VFVQGEYNFRVHADYGMGAFIGVDGAEHTPGNTWRHLQLNAGDLAVGSHEFEALGFDDCCDGHAELEVHLTCDSTHDDTAWRVVTASVSDCLKCDETAHLEAQYLFAGNADDEGGGHHSRLTSGADCSPNGRDGTVIGRARPFPSAGVAPLVVPW
jgi:hypothetical protein